MRPSSARYFDDFEASHGCTGRVGSVGRIRYDHLCSLGFATVSEVFWMHRTAVNSPCAPATGCSADLVHPRTNLEHVLHLVGEDGEQALELMLRLMGVNVCNSRKLSDDLVDLRVVSAVQDPGEGRSRYRCRNFASRATCNGVPSRVRRDGAIEQVVFAPSPLGMSGVAAAGNPGGWAVTGIFSAVVIEQVAHAFTPECVAHMDNCAARASMSCSEV